MGKLPSLISHPESQPRVSRPQKHFRAHVTDVWKVTFGILSSSEIIPMELVSVPAVRGMLRTLG